MNYQWRIVRLGLSDELNSDGVILENVIVNVRWKRIAIDEDGNTSSHLGSTDLSAKEVSSEAFISLDAITEATVLSWVQNSLPANKINIIEKNLQKKIEAKKVKVRKPNW
jgi:hypothetical protein